MKYEVTAVMSTVLRCVVEAESEEAAIALGKAVAENGLMEELQTSGEIGDWQVWPHRAKGAES